MTLNPKLLSDMQEAMAVAMEAQNFPPPKVKPTYPIFERLAVVFDDLSDEQQEFINAKRSQVAAGQELTTNDVNYLYEILDGAG